MADTPNSEEAYVKELMKKAAEAKTGEDAYRFAQAALHCANAIAVLAKNPSAVMGGS